MTLYTNDESDKSLRQRNFYLTVYIIPTALLAFLGGIIYWAYRNKYIEDNEIILACSIPLTLSLLLRTFNRRNWLKMPDGTYHNLKGVSPTTKLNFNEPQEYEAEYYYAKTEKAMLLLTGIAAIGLSIWLGFKKHKTILIPIVTNILGIFISYTGLTALLDKTPKLKIAKTGLWTKKLGFVKWDDINFADVVEDKSGKSTQLYLEIRLKGTMFEKANQPDERLLLTDLYDKESIEMVINTSILNHNKQKELNS